MHPLGNANRANFNRSIFQMQYEPADTAVHDQLTNKASTRHTANQASRTSPYIKEPQPK